MKRAVAICGARGYLGSHARHVFLEAGWRVIALDRRPVDDLDSESERDGEAHYRLDLRATEELCRVLAEERPTHCIHLAAPASVSASIERPSEDLEGHVLPTFSLLQAIRRVGLEVAVLVVSSAAVYGSPRLLPVREDAPAQPVSPYGFHTRLKELISLEHRDLYGTRLAIARVFSTYGPGLRHLAVWDITRRALNGDRTVRGAGGDSRDYLHAHDVAAALATLCDRAPFTGEIVNVGSGEETEIHSLAQLIYRELGIFDPILFDDQPEPGKPSRWHADVSSLKRLGFTPRVSMASGIRETVRWIARQRV